MYNEKAKHAICSFSGEHAFNSPSHWGYYANGFKGIAIEVEVSCHETNIVKMKYASEVVGKIAGEANGVVTKRILTTKLCSWAHEDEYRHLVEAESGWHKIGKITAVYFGMPYRSTVNSLDVRRQPSILQYRHRVVSLKKTAQAKSIARLNVDVVNGRVTAE